MPAIKSFVKENIENFVEFYTYHEKKKIKKALFEKLSYNNEYLTIKRLQLWNTLKIVYFSKKDIMWK